MCLPHLRDEVIAFAPRRESTFPISPPKQTRVRLRPLLQLPGLVRCMSLPTAGLSARVRSAAEPKDTGARPINAKTKGLKETTPNLLCPDQEMGDSPMRITFCDRGELPLEKITSILAREALRRLAPERSRISRMARKPWLSGLN
jgi:hypothetical protein